MRGVFLSMILCVFLNRYKCDDESSSLILSEYLRPFGTQRESFPLMKLFVNEVNENSVFGFRENTICICSSEGHFDGSIQIIKIYKIIKLCWAWLIKQSV